MMTGRDGKIRDFSAPPGQMRQEFIEKQNKIAEELFCFSVPGAMAGNQRTIRQPILDLAVLRIVIVLVLGLCIPIKWLKEQVGKNNY
jgi:hypothetical protein